MSSVSRSMKSYQAGSSQPAVFSRLQGCRAMLAPTWIAWLSSRACPCIVLELDHTATRHYLRRAILAEKDKRRGGNSQFMRVPASPLILPIPHDMVKRRCLKLGLAYLINNRDLGRGNPGL